MSHDVRDDLPTNGKKDYIMYTPSLLALIVTNEKVTNHNNDNQLVPLP